MSLKFEDVAFLCFCAGLVFSLIYIVATTEHTTIIGEIENINIDGELLNINMKDGTNLVCRVDDVVVVNLKNGDNVVLELERWGYKDWWWLESVVIVEMM